MAKKHTATQASERSVTSERARRLYRLLKLLAASPQTRSTLIKRLKLDIRGFYRDLEALRESGIEVRMAAQRYSLEQHFNESVQLLPFPDPHFTLGDATILAKGPSKAHRKLREELNRILKG